VFREVVAEKLHAPHHPIEKVSKQTGEGAGEAFGKKSSHILFLGVDAAQNLVLFHRILTDLS
jgi:hypothetical protein